MSETIFALLPLKMQNYYYKRNLPHYQPAGGKFFITFRLADTLPNSAINRLKQEYKLQIKNKLKRAEKRKAQKIYFKNFDKFLDKNTSGRNWLKQDKIAQVVSDKIIEFDTVEYTLICFCLMPNHVHLLIKLLTKNEWDKSYSTGSYPLTNILKLIKGSTAHSANKILNRKGQFWQHESYDHFVRDYDEQKRIIEYILTNPVKAGLAVNWKEWKWNYCKKEYASM